MTPAATLEQQPAPAPVQPGAPPRWLRIGLCIVLVLLGAMEALDGVLAYQIMLGGETKIIAGTGIVRALVAAHMVIQPILAFAVIILALTGRIRVAIMVLAVIALMACLRFIPTLFADGFGLASSANEKGVRVIALPLMAVGAIVLAARNQKLWLATALTGFSTLYTQTIGVLFFFTVLIVGF